MNIRDLDTGDILPIERVNQTYFSSIATEEALKRVRPLSPLPTIFPKIEEKAKNTDQRIALNIKEENGTLQMLLSDKIKPSILRNNCNFVFDGISGSTIVNDKESKPFVVYFLEISYQGQLLPANFPRHWIVYRRYQQFYKLNSCLRELGYNTPVLPHKTLLRRMKQNFINKRRIALEKWFFDLLKINGNSNITNLMQCTTFRRFLLENANGTSFSLIQSQQNSEKTDQKNKSSSKNIEQKEVWLNNFKLIQIIGRGSFGKVFLVKNKESENLYAMKVLKKENVILRQQVEHTFTERHILSCINHPFIIQLHSAFQTEKKLFLVLDYCAGGDLFFHLSRMQKFPEKISQLYVAEIALALDHLHLNHILFRDLKLENILLDEIGHIKLVDFGLAKEGVIHLTEGADTLCGTPEYLCPDLLEKKGYGLAVDWWNLGTALYEMLTGFPPWYTSDRYVLFSQIKSAPLCIPAYVSRNASLLINGLLNRDPKKRFRAAQLKVHPFFASIDWDQLINKKIAPIFHPCERSPIWETVNFEHEYKRLPIKSEENIQEQQLTSNNQTNQEMNNLFNHFSFRR
jgi:serum/glucocorticoid-regulated kinase 3